MPDNHVRFTSDKDNTVLQDTSLQTFFHPRNEWTHFHMPRKEDAGRATLVSAVHQQNARSSIERRIVRAVDKLRIDVVWRIQCRRRDWQQRHRNIR